ncbi:MAG: hypothetical protein ACQEXE_25335, partial [Bacillota bacterium]
IVFSKKTNDLNVDVLFVQFSKINPPLRSDFINISFLNRFVNNFFQNFQMLLASQATVFL